MPIYLSSSGQEHLHGLRHSGCAINVVITIDTYSISAPQSLMNSGYSRVKIPHQGWIGKTCQLSP
jgi:hypothetical protein